jgi:hypothetical protein
MRPAGFLSLELVDTNDRVPDTGRVTARIGDGGTKGGATYRFRPETAMLAWSGSP